MSTLPWVDDLAKLVGQLGTAEFAASFHALFARVLSVEQCTVFEFPRQGAPRALLVEASSTELADCARSLAAQYVAGDFAHDPNLAQHGDEPLSVHCLAPEELPDEQYRLRFYDAPRIAHELVLLGRNADTLYCTSFYRMGGHDYFQARDIELLRSMATLAVQLLSRHSQLITLLGSTPDPAIPAAAAAPMSPAKRAQVLLHLKQVLLTQPHLLSPREAEVCAGIILGYTTLGLSLNLGISINTVATHRKRAYQKLGVSSQNELFMRYHEFVSRRH